jgi:hypothetical protein
MRARLIAFYKQYNPGKLSDPAGLENTLAHYRGTRDAQPATGAQRSDDGAGEQGAKSSCSLT